MSHTNSSTRDTQCGTRNAIFVSCSPVDTISTRGDAVADSSPFVSQHTISSHGQGVSDAVLPRAQSAVSRSAVDEVSSRGVEFRRGAILPCGEVAISAELLDLLDEERVQNCGVVSMPLHVKLSESSRGRAGTGKVPKPEIY